MMPLKHWGACSAPWLLVFESPVFCLFWEFCHWYIAIKIPQHNWGTQKGLRTGKDRTDPEILCSHTLNVMVNFNGNVLTQKKGQKAKKPDFQTLPVVTITMTFQSLQGCTAVSIDTCTALARFIGHF